MKATTFLETVNDASYWLRSPTDEVLYMYAFAYGSIGYSANVSHAYGIRPAFTLAI